LESQRVKFLLEGYLRGWLDFKYPQPTSSVREELIIYHLQEQAAYELLENKLFIETTLRSTIPSKAKNFLDPIFDIQRSMVGLKLPSALPKDTIKQDEKPKELTADDLNTWKEFLENVNKK
jgi:hypothetical protein